MVQGAGVTLLVASLLLAGTSVAGSLQRVFPSSEQRRLSLLAAGARPALVHHWSSALTHPTAAQRDQPCMSHGVPF